MIPKLTIRLDLGDGPFTVTTTLPAWWGWETKTGKAVSELQNGFGIKDITILAYEACKVHKVIVPSTVEAFVNKIVDGPSLDDGGEQQNPTDEALSTDS